MNKNLKIDGKNVKIVRGSKSLELNGKNLEEIICENLPSDMENFSYYFADVQISINIHERGELKTETNYDEEDKEC